MAGDIVQGRNAVIVLSVALALGLLAAGPTTRPIPEPTTRPSKGFTITGTLTPPERVREVRLINRQDPQNYPAKQLRVFRAAFDRETGRFVAERLPQGYYDLIVETTVGQIDGVDLRDTPDRFDLAPDREPQAPLTEKDLKWIDDHLQHMRTFENKKRLLFVNGNATRARALVEKIRDEATTLPSEEPEAIWRVEVWRFQKQYGAWSRTAWEVVYRQRMPLRQFRQLNWTFEPALGGLPSAPGSTTDIGQYAIPERFDPEKGRTPY